LSIKSAYPLSAVIPRFTRLAVASTILLVATGIYNSWIHLLSFWDLLETSYGLVLLFKIILFLPMLALGGFNTFVTRPRAEKLVGVADSADERQKALRDFYRALRIEAALGIIILLLAAILAFLPPSRHHRHSIINKSEEAATSTII
jgi:copper resistance protein D